MISPLSIATNGYLPLYPISAAADGYIWVEQSQSRGGVSHKDAKSYLEKLKRLANISKLKDITEEVIEAAQVLDDLPVVAPQIEAIADMADAMRPLDALVDIKSLQDDLDKIQAYIETHLIEQEKRAKMRRLEEEFIILMTIH